MSAVDIEAGKVSFKEQFGGVASNEAVEVLAIAAGFAVSEGAPYLSRWSLLSALTFHPTSRTPVNWEGFHLASKRPDLPIPEEISRRAKRGVSFTSQAELAIRTAVDLANEMGHTEVTSDHLLVGTLNQFRESAVKVNETRVGTHAIKHRAMIRLQRVGAS